MRTLNALLLYMIATRKLRTIRVAAKSGKHVNIAIG